MSDCKFAWCEQDDGPGHDLHHGKLVTACAGESEAEVWAVLDLNPEVASLTYTFEMDWSIASGDSPAEFADLRSIIDQMEAAIAAADEALSAELRAVEVTGG
jgi:hypothetical protein